MDPKNAEFLRLVAKAGWTQAETARRLQITPGAVSQIRSGIIRPRQSLLNLLKLVVGAPAGRTKPSASHSARPASSWENELLACVRKLPDSQRQLVLSLARELSA